MKAIKNVPQPISIKTQKGNDWVITKRFNLNKLKNGNFAYEGYMSDTRFLRYLGKKIKSKSAEYTHAYTNRTHNIDLYNDCITIENNNSSWFEVKYATVEDAKLAFEDLIGLPFKKIQELINNNRQLRADILKRNNE